LKIEESGTKEKKKQTLRNKQTLNQKNNLIGITAGKRQSSFPRNKLMLYLPKHANAMDRRRSNW
jgi:hypothetical protein